MNVLDFLNSDFLIHIYERTNKKQISSANTCSRDLPVQSCSVLSQLLQPFSRVVFYPNQMTVFP